MPVLYKYLHEYLAYLACTWKFAKHTLQHRILGSQQETIEVTKNSIKAVYRYTLLKEPGIDPVNSHLIELMRTNSTAYDISNMDCNSEGKHQFCTDTFVKLHKFSLYSRGAVSASLCTIKQT